MVRSIIKITETGEKIMPAKIETRDYTHQLLDKQYGGISGYYTPRKEVRLNYQSRQVLYIVGHAVVESSCCGSGNWDYVLVPGFVVDWNYRRSQSGLMTSSVQPIAQVQDVKELTSIIQASENTDCITFW
jgi:hypothetical protein